MIYENMLLSAGGGLELVNKLMGADPECASLILGIGQTGIRAMQQLKKKVFHDLQGDDREEEPPRFGSIRFLGIDSDPDSAQGLEAKEFFCLADGTLGAALRNKPLLQQDPALNWLDLENTPIPMMEHNHGGVRSLGRYLLVKKAGDLTRVLHARCNEALHAHQARRIQVFLLADLTGTIGSSCYMDICYLLRRAAKEALWPLNIYGYFFLPDMDSIDPATARDSFSRTQSNARCYAALKELDYLMNLPVNQDRFTMRYDDHLTVDTQDRPVDVCFLMAEDRQSALRKVTDHILWALTAPVRDEYGFTDTSFNGYVTNAFQDMLRTPILNDAYRCYFTLGSAMAEYTLTPLINYLACGFFQKLSGFWDPAKATVSPSEAAVFAKKFQLDAPSIYTQLRKQIPDITLPAYDKKELAAQPVPPKGTLNMFWAQAGNDWLNQCQHKLEVASRQLCQDDSQIQHYGRRIRFELDLMAYRQAEGPWYAVTLLKALYEGSNSPIETALQDAQKKLAQQQERHKQAGEALEQAKLQFHGKLPTKARYEAYYQAARHWFNCTLSIHAVKKVITVLQTVKQQLQDLEKSYFRPLAELLENLQETFAANMADPKIFTRQTECRCLTDTEQLMKEADEAVETLADQAITKFVSELANAEPAVLVTDPEQLRKLVTQYIFRTFPEFLDPPIHETLHVPLNIFRFHPTDDPEQLYLMFKEMLNRDILPDLITGAAPNFPFIPTFEKKTAVEQNIMRIPRTFSRITDSYIHIYYQNRSHDFGTLINVVQDRFVLEQWYAGFPLYAYDGLLRLKKDYDAHNKAGLHLHRDWAAMLPEPLPYSVYPEFANDAQEAETLLEEARQKGLLLCQEYDRYIRITRDTEEEQVRIPTLFKDDRPDTARCREALETVQAAIARSREEETYVRLPMKRSDGSLQKRMDMDRLLSSPKLLQLLRLEVERYDRRAALMEKLENLPAEGIAYNEELDTFCQLLCYGILAAPAAHFSNSADTTALVHCRFMNDYNEPVAHCFSSRTKEAGREYPLYVAFREFCSMNPYSFPRKDMEAVLHAAIALPQTPEDHCIARELLIRLNDEVMQELLSVLEGDENWELRRFYMGLRRHLDRWKEAAPCWPEEDVQLQPKLRCLPASPNRCCQVLDLQDGKILLYYPATSTQFVYDPESNLPRPLRPDMKVWDGKNWADPDRSDTLYL